MYTADELNAALASGRHVQVTTYLRSTLYRPGLLARFGEAGVFFQGKDGNLYVRRGRSRTKADCLSMGGRMLVHVRVELAQA